MFPWNNFAWSGAGKVEGKEDIPMTWIVHPFTHCKLQDAIHTWFNYCLLNGKMVWSLSFLWSTVDHVTGEIDEKCEPVITLDGGRGWRCVCCGKEFGTRSSCRRHVETLHYVPPRQDCELCGKILKNKNSHQNHMIMVHGHKKRMW